MPKNSTVTKRTSSASSKKNGLKKRFDLTNRKVQFFVVIAIVAVLGGGYFTVRSFANTIAATWTGHQLIQDTWVPNTCSFTKGTESGKNNAPTMDVRCPSYGGQLITPQTLALGSGTYQACVNVKGNGNMSIWTSPGFDATIKRYTLINDGSYREYCTNNVTITSGTKLEVTMGIYGPSNGWALQKILDVKLKKVPSSTTTSPAPAPAPTK